jgi:peroxiredoxin
MRAWWAVAAGCCVALALSLVGCLVDSGTYCRSHAQCPGNESCDPLTSRCRVECETDEDCKVNGMYVGKECASNRCEFRYDERVSAPNFCSDVANAKSSYHGQQLCLADLKGKVVLIYFGQLDCPSCAQQANNLETEMLDVLRSQGLNDVEFLAVTTSSQGGGWEDHAAGYETVGFPVLVDRTMGVFFVYGAVLDDIFLVDKQSRLVTKTEFSLALVNELNSKIRELHLE